MAKKKKRDEKKRIILRKSKQSKIDSESLTLKERILRLEILLNIVDDKK